MITIKLQNEILNYSKDRKFDKSILKTQAIGFSAQEVQKVFPEAVGKDDDGYLNLNIHAILIAYTNAFKEQQAQIDELKKIVTAQQKIIEQLLYKK